MGSLQILVDFIWNDQGIPILTKFLIGHNY